MSKKLNKIQCTINDDISELVNDVNQKINKIIKQKLCDFIENNLNNYSNDIKLKLNINTNEYLESVNNTNFLESLEQPLIDIICNKLFINIDYGIK